MRDTRTDINASTTQLGSSFDECDLLAIRSRATLREFSVAERESSHDWPRTEDATPPLPPPIQI